MWGRRCGGGGGGGAEECRLPVLTVVAAGDWADRGRKKGTKKQNRGYRPRRSPEAQEEPITTQKSNGN